MKRTVFVLLLILSTGSACSLHKTAQPTDPSAPVAPARKPLLSMPLPPQDCTDHFWQQNWRNNG